MCILLRRYQCFLFKQKTAYELRISDWSSDVCSSDLVSLAVCENVRPGTICATSARFDICWFFSASPLIAETERPTYCRFWLRLLAVTMISSPEPAAGPSCPHAGNANAAHTAHVTNPNARTSLINPSRPFLVHQKLGTTPYGDEVGRL